MRFIWNTIVIVAATTLLYRFMVWLWCITPADIPTMSMPCLVQYHPLVLQTAAAAIILLCAVITEVKSANKT